MDSKIYAVVHVFLADLHFEAHNGSYNIVPPKMTYVTKARNYANALSSNA